MELWCFYYKQMSQTSSERPPGEKVLISIQENRHEQNRLKDINKQLEMLKSDEEVHNIVMVG